MSNLKQQIKEDLKLAMKSGDKAKLSTLRLLVAEIEKESIEMKMKTSELTNEQVQKVISRQIKKLDKEIEAYKAVNRSVEPQNLERELLLAYMPKQLTEAEIREEVYRAIALVERAEIVNPMKYLSQKLKGKADMSLVAKITKELSK